MKSAALTFTNNAPGSPHQVPLSGRGVLPDGGPCVDRDECQSNCVDGVCCNTACNGAMEACNIPGTEGMCTRTLPDGEPCTDREECESQNCVDGVCCNTPCDGPNQACNIPGAEGMCTPTLPDGESCTKENQCSSNFCVDAVCCNRLCDGPAETCNLQGSAGTCTTVAAPAPTTSRTGLLIALGILTAIAALALRRRRKM